MHSKLLCSSAWLVNCLANIVCNPAIADEQGQTVDDIVVTAVRTTNELSEIPNTTTVVDSTDIELRNGLSVADLLRSIPGIHVTQPSGQGGVASVFIRGGDLEMTMVLLDGIRVNDPNDSRGSAFDLSTIHMSDVERVEIVRGPQSAAYGSNALAGVINIIGKRSADEPGVSVLAETGTDGYYRGAANLSGPIGAAGGFSFRMATVDDGEPVTGTTFTSDAVRGRLSFGAGDRWDLKLISAYTESEGTAFPEDSGGAELAVLRETDIRSAEDLRLGLIGGVAVGDNWRLNAFANWYDHDSRFVSPGMAPGVRDPVPRNGADANLERFNVAVNAVVALGANVTATIGVDYYDEDGVSAGYVEFAPGFEVPAGFEFDRSVAGGFAEMHYKSGIGFSLLASMRHDDPDEERGETTSRLGILYDFSNGRTSFRANRGEGFSLPGFFALASPLVGNPGLRPETSESYDLGLTHRSADEKFSLTVTLFRNEFRNLIDFDSTTFRMVNRDRLEVGGIETQFEYTPRDSLDLVLQATYLDPEFRSTSTPVLHRPEWRGSLHLRWSPSDKWSFDASWLNVGESKDSSVPTGVMVLGGYDRIDVTATFDPAEKLDIFLSADNLLDADYQEAIGFPSPGIRARLGIRYRF
jgi:outer membrane cobalamin receptor